MSKYLLKVGNMTMPLTAHRTVDTRGLPGPLPVLKAERAMADLGPDEVLEVLATGPIASGELLDWVERCGHTLLGQGTVGRLHQFYIRKSKTPQ